MTRSELIAKVNSSIAEEFEVAEDVITPQADIKEVLELDSLSLVDLVALIDRELGVKLTGTELSQIKTFEALYDCLEEKGV